MLFFRDYDFLLCKHNCISYAWLQIFGRSRQVKLGCKMGHCMKKVPRIRENYHRVPRIREIGSLQIQTGFLTFSLKKTWLIMISQVEKSLMYLPAILQILKTTIYCFQTLCSLKAWKSDEVHSLLMMMLIQTKIRLKTQQCKMAFSYPVHSAISVNLWRILQYK